MFLTFVAFLEAMVWAIFWDPTLFRESKTDLLLFVLAQGAIAFNLVFGWKVLRPEPVRPPHSGL